MGIAHILSPTTVCSLSSNPTKTLKNPKFSSEFRCASSSRSNWDPNPNASRTGRFRFEEDIGFDRREKRRKWWSDDDDDDDEEDDDDDVFGFWEEPSAIDWIFKVFRAFGWMVPAILISTLLGTGPNSLIMALVLPLGQTALSIAMDKLWGGPSSNPNPKSRHRPRPRARSSSRPRPERNPSDGIFNKEARESRTGKRPVRESYQAWGTAKSGSRFGGWDELDEETASNTNFPREEQNRNVDEVSRQHSRTGKLSRRRNREKPLLMRLLVAVFPFLGSWTNFLF